MESGVRVAASCSVLLAGILTALLFRHDVPDDQPATAGADRRLVLGEQRQPGAGGLGPGQTRDRSTPPRSGFVAAGAAGSRVTVLRPMEVGQPPPALAKDYPGSDGRGGAGWGNSIGLPPAPGRDDSPRTHRVVDGDTLPALAERYLDSADRWPEIYEANRDVLASPGLLPIGADLTIPSRHRPTPASAEPATERPLVPILRPRAEGG